MACTAWVDIRDMISSRAVSVLCDGAPDEELVILETMAEGSERKPRGACLRWAAIIGDSGRLELMLQSLPLPETLLTSKPLLRGDSTPVIGVKSFQIEYRAFDGDMADGPVPTIYCGEDTKELFSNNPKLVHAQMQKLAGIFAKPEILAFKEAAAMVKKPRVGAFELAFKRKYREQEPAATTTQAAKKPRLVTATETGSHSHHDTEYLTATYPPPPPLWSIELDLMFHNLCEPFCSFLFRIQWSKSSFPIESGRRPLGAQGDERERKGYPSGGNFQKSM
jgi:hypothetical protein